MRQKVSTIVDEALLRQTKLEAVRQGKQFSEVVAEALESYLKERGSPGARGGVVADSWGALPLNREEVGRILAEEDGLLDA